MREHQPGSTTSACRDSLTRALTATTVALSAVYLLWRATTLGHGPALLLSIPLFLAELSALAHLACIIVQAWHRPTSSPPVSRYLGPDQPPTDIVVTAQQAGVEEIERTLVGCATLLGPHRVVVFDDRHRPKVKAMADAYSARYDVGSTGDGLADHLADETSSELVVWLTAGDVPMPGLLEAAVPVFDHESIALLQIGIGLLNPDSLAHQRRGRDEHAFIRQVAGPATGQRGVGPWLGSGSVLRRQAFVDIGGLHTDGSTPHQQTLVRLHRAGWASAFEPKPLVRTTAPDRLSDYLGDRRSRAREGLALLTSSDRPVFGHRLTPVARWTHLARSASFAPGLRLLVYVGILSATLVSGRMPFTADPRLVAVLWATTAGLAAVVRHRLARGTMAIGDWTRQAWRLLGADLGALAQQVGAGSGEPSRAEADAGIRSLGRLRLLTGAVITLDLAVLARASTMLNDDLLPAFSTTERMIVLGLGLGMLVPMIDVLQMQVRRVQRRASFRRAAVLPIEFANQQTETLDLTPHGVGITGDHAPPVGREASFRVLLPRPDGSSVLVEGQATVRAASSMGNGLVRVGLEFTELDDDGRAALIRYCAIDHAILSGEQVSLPEVTPGDLDVARSAGQGVALRAITGLAVILGLATFGFGPGASAVRAADSVAVCLTDSSGGPIAGGQVAHRAAGSSTAIGVTGADGCVQSSSLGGVSTVDMTYLGVRSSLTQDVTASPTVVFATRPTTVRLVRPSGAPIAGAEVRTFADGWHRAGVTNNTGEVRVETLPGSLQYEIAWKGGRVVQAHPADADPVVTFTAVRLVADPGVVVRQVDLGAGWRGFTDGMEVLPGAYAFRLTDGGVAKLTASAGSQLSVPSGAVAEITPDYVPPTDEANPTSTTVVATTTSVAVDPAPTGPPLVTLPPAPSTTTTGIVTTTTAPPPSTTLALDPTTATSTSTTAPATTVVPTGGTP